MDPYLVLRLGRGGRLGRSCPVDVLQWLISELARDAVSMPFMLAGSVASPWENMVPSPLLSLVAMRTMLTSAMHC
jgi:hypothetical protein